MRLFFIVLVGMALTGNCQSQSIKVQPNGLKIDSTSFAVGKTNVKDNSFSEGTKVHLRLLGVRGFAIKDGKSFPGCSMKVTDSKGKSVVVYDDLFEGGEGVSNEDARYLAVDLTIGSPMEINKDYNWDVKVWDKVTKSEVTISAIIHVIPAKDLLGIKKKSQGLTCESTVVLYNLPLTINECHMEEKLTFVFSGVKGFALNKEGKVNLGAQMIVRDSKGNNLIEISDLFKEENSYEPSLTESIRLYLTVGDPMAEGNIYNWFLKIWDKNSAGFIEASVPLNVVSK